MERVRHHAILETDRVVSYRERSATRESNPPKKSGPSDEIVRALERLQAGIDVDRSFRIVYDAYFVKVRRLFERKGVSPEDRPDLIQTTFMRIYSGVKGLKDRYRFEAFLRTTATRVFLKWLERASSQSETIGGRTRVVPSDDEVLDYLVSDEPWPIPLTPVASPEADLEYKRLVDRVRQGIDEMPAAMARCARLRFVNGLTNKEITEVLRKKPGDVGYQLFQARKRLAQALRSDEILINDS